jgi:hypothetical protein
MQTIAVVARLLLRKKGAKLDNLAKLLLLCFCVVAMVTV